MSSCKQNLSGDGLWEVRMQNRHLRLSVLADAGGKISELIDRRSGRNWLWRNPHIPFRRAVYDADYGRELDSGGWDEVLLSMSPGEFDFAGRSSCRIPDHGDVVGQRWSIIDVDVNAAGDAICEMAVAGRALRFKFRRTLRLNHDSPRLEISYSLTNDEAFAWPWYWGAHALLAGRRDLRIELPDKQPYRIDHAANGFAGAAGHEHNWPDFPLATGKSFDLSRCFDRDAAPAEFAGKIFVRSPESGLVSVSVANSKQRLALHYDPQELPWLGLWINNGGWSGCDSEPYLNLGLEPTTAAFDCVAQAMDDGAISWLQPGETRDWALAVELHS